MCSLAHILNLTRGVHDFTMRETPHSLDVCNKKFMGAMFMGASYSHVSNKEFMGACSWVPVHVSNKEFT